MRPAPQRSTANPGPRSLSGLALLLGAILLGSSPGAGQGSPESGTAPSVEGPFFDSIEVSIVNVDVVVTDRSGRPVLGLTAEDFELLEDGEPMVIENFYSSRPTAAPGESPDAAPITASAEKPAPSAGLKTPAEQRLTVAVFVDQKNLRATTRKQVLQALRDAVVSRIGDAGQVLLATYDGALEIRQGLTGDPERLLAAIDEISGESAGGVLPAMERAAILRGMAENLEMASLATSAAQSTGAFTAGGKPDWQESFQSIHVYAAERRQEIERALNALQGFVDLVAGLPGRKAVLYVSDGLELRPGEALFHAWNELAGSSGAAPRSIVSEVETYDATRLFEAVGRHANANRVTLYPIAAGGRNATLTPAEQRAVAAGVGSTSVFDQRFQDMESLSRQASMGILARATGGRAMLDALAVDSALQGLHRDFESYYSLGYASRQADGQEHKIVVRVRDRSLLVRHRESYLAKSAEEHMRDRTRSALEFGPGPGDNPLGVTVEFGEPKKDKKDRLVVPVLIKVPIAKLLLVPQERSHAARLSVFVGSRDLDGNLSPIRSVPAPLQVPNDKLMTALGQVAGYRVSLLLRRGEHQIVVGVRDELAQVEAVTRRRFVPEGAAGSEGASPR